MIPNTQKDPGAQDAPAFVVPCATLGMDAPWRWLRKGWQDLHRTPRLTAVFGVVIVIVSILMAMLAWKLGRFALLATLLSGFVFLAPLICVGLYCVSRNLERGCTPKLDDSFVLARRVLGQAGVYALGQGVIVLLWSRAGMMVSALSPITAGDMRALWEFLIIGSLVGAVFAGLTFAVAAFSLPLIADRNVDMVTAGISSVHAVLRNKAVMALWAFLIVVLTMVGFATAFIGLAVIIPWLAYATWHAYRETLDPSAWPLLD